MVYVVYIQYTYSIAYSIAMRISVRSFLDSKKVISKDFKVIHYQVKRVTSVKQSKKRKQYSMQD